MEKRIIGRIPLDRKLNMINRFLIRTNIPLFHMLGGKLGTEKTTLFSKSFRIFETSNYRIFFYPNN